MKGLIGLGFHERCAFFARICAVSYYDAEDINKKIEGTDFLLLNFYESDGTQGASFISDTDIIIVCRGTDAYCWRDTATNLYAWPENSPSGGRVHGGFSYYASNIWPQIKNDLNVAKERNLNVWFTGHSLGGAMATVLASRCQKSEILPDPVQLFTFGSPRVGWPSYVDSININHVRWVNNNDVVAYLPPWWLGYKHHGSEFYLNTWGNVRDLTKWQRIKDKCRGFWFAWKNRKIDSFSDHDISSYVRRLERYANNMEVLQR